MLSIVFVSFIFSLMITNTYTAVQCYSCNPCGTTWNPSGATVIQTSNPNDYCRVSLIEYFN